MADGRSRSVTFWQTGTFQLMRPLPLTEEDTVVFLALSIAAASKEVVSFAGSAERDQAKVVACGNHEDAWLRVIVTVDEFVPSAERYNDDALVCRRQAASRRRAAGAGEQLILQTGKFFPEDVVAGFCSSRTGTKTITRFTCTPVCRGPNGFMHPR
jgi:hypothetical protein